MSDKLTKEQRHLCMSHVKNKNTSPELILRKAIWQKGFRYVLHSKKLPGHPDIVFPKYKTVLFVNGCFWHGHRNCKKASIPKTNELFWSQKISSNIARDLHNKQMLEALGWKVLVVWECMLKKKEFDRTVELIVSALQAQQSITSD